MTDTSHILACRNSWVKHAMNCDVCDNHGNRCDLGNVLHEEYVLSIEHHPQAEKVILHEN